MLKIIEDEEHKRRDASGSFSHVTLNTKFTGTKNKSPNNSEMTKKTQ